MVKNKMKNNTKDLIAIILILAFPIVLFFLIRLVCPDEWRHFEKENDSGIFYGVRTDGKGVDIGIEIAPGVVIGF